MLTPQTIGLLMLAGSVGLATLVTLALLIAMQFSEKTPTWYYNKGMDAYQTGHRDKAIAWLLKAIHKKADYVDAHYNLGLLYMQSEKANEARMHFEHVLSVRPDDADTLYNLALMDYADDNLELVTQRLDAISALDGDGWYLKGLTCESLGQEAEAIEALVQASQMSPENVACWILLGKLYDKAHQADKAVESFLQVLEVDPNNLEGNYDISMSYAKLSQWDEALQYSRRAVEIDPHYAKAHNQLGLACYCTENYEEAIEHYQAAIQIEPDYANAYNNLGYAYQKAEQYDKAIEMFEAYIEREEQVSGETSETREIQEHVDMLKKKLLEA